MTNVPEKIKLGQVYQYGITDDYVMVGMVGDGYIGLMIISGDNVGLGCYLTLSKPVRNIDEIRDILIYENALYVGMFNEIFTLKEDVPTRRELWLASKD